AQYAAQHSSPQEELFERLAAETREKSSAPQMMVGLLEGRFLGALVGMLRARRVLELGTFTGYSSISMALALPPDGRLITCDVNEETTENARAIRAVNELVLEDPRVQNVLLTVRDGMSLVWWA